MGEFGLPGVVPGVFPRTPPFCFETKGCSLLARNCSNSRPAVRGRHGGVEKRGGWKTSRMTPLPKRGFGPPLVRYVFHPLQVSVLCFSGTKIHDRADQKLFWRGPKIFGRARSLVRFPPPIRFAPPHITAQCRGGEHRRGEGSETFLQKKWLLRRFPEVS